MRDKLPAIPEIWSVLFTKACNQRFPIYYDVGLSVALSDFYVWEDTND